MSIDEKAFQAFMLAMHDNGVTGLGMRKNLETYEAAKSGQPTAFDYAKPAAKDRVSIMSQTAISMATHQPDECPDCGSAMIEVCSGLEINARGEYARRCIEPLWECFCDEAYFQQWAVREIGERRWGHCFHVASKEEADGLVELFNSRPKRESGTPENDGWLRIEPVTRHTDSERKIGSYLIQFKYDDLGNATHHKTTQIEGGQS